MNMSQVEEVTLRQSIGKNQWPRQECCQSNKSTDTERMRKEGGRGSREKKVRQETSNRRQDRLEG